MASDPPKPAPPSQDEPWRKLGEYKIVADIAEGTFGMVKGTSPVVAVAATYETTRLMTTFRGDTYRHWN